MDFRESDLVLNVSKNVDPAVWDEGKYAKFFDILFKNRTYQREATEAALRYMNSGEYNSLEELAKENFYKNEVIRERYNNNMNAFISDLGLPNMLSATIDLATGTGKSYVMYAIAVCMLAEGKVDKVLVLAPSITIESELTIKFKNLAENEQLNASLGIGYVPPSIINGDQTIVENSIAIENRDAIYRTQENRNSIVDSLSGKGERTLVLNDEVHHVFYSEGNQWKYFIEDEGKKNIKFRYVIGLTGTAYKRKGKTGDANEYLADVIYRYSLKEAIEDGFVKDIEYIDKADMPTDADERWQIILDSHNKILQELEKLNGIKPITIIVTGEKRRADAQTKKFKDFLKKKRNMSDEEVNEVVLCVHSGDNVSNDRIRLKDVDKDDNPVEFIFSVSMLTEGWDVKRVFQIVPDEERAFNSKLLIAQVLGRGLRRPDGWKSEWGIPKVIIFNHENWAPRVKNLVEELLDFKKSITVGTRDSSELNFDILNVSYEPKETSVTKTVTSEPISFLENGYVKLPTDSEVGNVQIELFDIQSKNLHNRMLQYVSETYTVKNVAQQMYNRFSDLPTDEKKTYYEELWHVDKLEKMIQDSLDKSSNKVITRKIKNAFINSLNVLFRDCAKSVSYESVPTKYEYISTSKLQNVTIELSSLKKNKVMFYSDEYLKQELDDASKVSIVEIEDTTNCYRHQKIQNSYLFKTPQTGIITTGEPETKFVKRMIEENTVKAIDSFVKSSDTGFYCFDYTWQKGSHHQIGQFNPDFFIKKKDIVIVVEIKDDSQISNPDIENLGKYRAANSHFQRINAYFERHNKKSRYKFTFLTPKNYDTFFNMLLDDNVESIMNFNSELDVKLSQNKES